MAEQALNSLQIQRVADQVSEHNFLALKKYALLTVTATDTAGVEVMHASVTWVGVVLRVGVRIVNFLR